MHLAFSPMRLLSLSDLFLGSVLAFLILRWFKLRKRAAVLAKMNKKFEADLADRRDIERELAHMASFADMAPNPIIETDAQASLGYVNPVAEREFPDLKVKGRSHPLFEGLATALEVLSKDEKTLMTRPVKVGERIYDQQISLLNG